MGSHPMRHSTPLRSVQLTIGLPKPTENRSMATPHQRAAQKWPSSWIVTTTVSTIRNGRGVEHRAMQELTQIHVVCAFGRRAPAIRPLATSCARACTANAVSSTSMLLSSPDRPHRLQGLADDCGNTEKADAAVQKGRNRHLVGRVQRRWRAAAGSERLGARGSEPETAQDRARGRSARRSRRGRGSARAKADVQASSRRRLWVRACQEGRAERCSIHPPAPPSNG